MKFYGLYDAHKHSLASLYAGSVKTDKYQAKVRNYPSARTQALFPDKVPEAVYDNLVKTINENLPVLHEYYELRMKILGLRELRHYDVYVPLVPEAKSRHSYREAVDIVIDALAPLGGEYTKTLKSGLLGGWVDRYENKGKRSGAFSAGSFSGKPYILLNYKEDVLHDMFTMAHEGGHSMHSWYSVANNPFLCYNYSIFEAEVASTFNEQLLFDHLFKRSNSEQERASLLATRIDGVLGTLFRQTMFAEYEAITHAMAESGQALTLEALRAEYRKLLVKYFGPLMKFETVSDRMACESPIFTTPSTCTSTLPASRRPSPSPSACSPAGTANERITSPFSPPAARVFPWRPSNSPASTWLAPNQCAPPAPNSPPTSRRCGIYSGSEPGILVLRREKRREEAASGKTEYSLPCADPSAVLPGPQRKAR